MPLATGSDKYTQALARLTGLYQRDPQAFEAARQQLIRQAIEEFPPEYRQRAYGQQFQLEARLDRYRDPLVRMNVMVEIFWEQVEQFRKVLNDPLAVIAEREGGKKEARVIPLRKKRPLS